MTFLSFEALAPARVMGSSRGGSRISPRTRLIENTDIMREREDLDRAFVGLGKESGYRRRPSRSISDMQEGLVDSVSLSSPQHVNCEKSLLCHQRRIFKAQFVNGVL